MRLPMDHEGIFSQEDASKYEYWASPRIKWNHQSVSLWHKLPVLVGSYSIVRYIYSLYKKPAENPGKYCTPCVPRPNGSLIFILI